MSPRKTKALQTMAAAWGVKLPATPVCRGHNAPLDFLRCQLVDRPPVVVALGARGSGKSFGSALDTHLTSKIHPKHQTRILGGSLAQSRQIYEALQKFGDARPHAWPWKHFGKEAARYHNRSVVEILACSPKSVRGPHVPTLKLDEVDEIDPELRQAALGMSMDDAKAGVPGMVVYTSTWHKLGGPMTEIIEQGRAGKFPLFCFCLFEVLERCPEERSGPDLERCPECPLVKWCHEGRDDEPGGLPKAKRSNGHYTIASAIQKVQAVSERIFRADYLCAGPKADGVWFKDFDPTRHVDDGADYDPTLPVHVSIDSGVYTGGVVFQLVAPPYGGIPTLTIFGELLLEGVAAFDAAGLMLAEVVERCGLDARRRVSTDSAGGARNPVGPTVIAEYRKAGLIGENDIETWPKYAGCVAEGLATLEALIKSADGAIHLRVNPRCVRTIAALSSYSRAKRGGQWQDYPEDPQHPHEDIVDAIRGGVKLLMPEGLQVPGQGLRNRPARKVF